MNVTKSREEGDNSRSAGFRLDLTFRGCDCPLSGKEENASLEQPDGVLARRLTSVHKVFKAILLSLQPVESLRPFCLFLSRKGVLYIKCSKTSDSASGVCMKHIPSIQHSKTQDIVIRFPPVSQNSTILHQEKQLHRTICALGFLLWHFTPCPKKPLFDPPHSPL